MEDFVLNKTKNWRDIIQNALESPIFRGLSDESDDDTDDSETIESGEEPKYEEDISFVPIYGVPNAITEALVGESSPPGDYKEDKDIGDKAVKDDWMEYLDSQEKLKKLVIVLLLLFLLVPLLGLLCACCCRRCRMRTGCCTISRYCGLIFLTIAGVLMLLSLLFAILAATQLNKSLKTAVDCYSKYKSGKAKSYYVFKSNTEDVSHLYDIKYTKFLKQVVAESESTPELAHAEVMKYLSKALRTMQGAKPILEEVRNDLTDAKGLAIRFKDVLRGVKQNLKVYLTWICNKKVCKDFYRNNEIWRLDKGCLQYNKLPPTKDFTKAIDELLAGNFVNSPLMAAQKNAKAKEEKKSGPASALREKLGPPWYTNTLGWLLLLLLVPGLLLIGLLVALFSCRHGRRMLCAFMIAGIIFFVLNIILILFFLLHGSLAHQIYCGGGGGSKKSIDVMAYVPHVRSGDPLQNSVRNESFYGVLIRRKRNIKKYFTESREKPKNATIPGSNPQAATVDGKLSSGTISINNSLNFTWTMCMQLVPEPLPGPLWRLIEKLDNLTWDAGESPFLLNQTNYLRIAYRELAQPLAAIIQRLRDNLRQLDQVLSGGYGGFARHMSSLIEKIKNSVPGHDDKLVANAVTPNISYFPDSGRNNGTNYVRHSRSPRISLKLDMDREVQGDDLCKRIANPMNALWFWLLVFTLLIIPSLCCAKLLRCALCCARCPSRDTLVCCDGENFVAHSTLPVELASHCPCYRYLPVCEEPSCDYLDANACHC